MFLFELEDEYGYSRTECHSRGSIAFKCKFSKNVVRARWMSQVTTLGSLGLLSWSLTKSGKRKTRQELLGLIREPMLQ
jgi:hypothetical protein